VTNRAALHFLGGELYSDGLAIEGAATLSPSLNGKSRTMLDRISDGRTDLVFDHLSEGHAANSTDRNGVALITV